MEIPFNFKRMAWIVRRKNIADEEFIISKFLFLLQKISNTSQVKFMPRDVKEWGVRRKI